jgi:hypothetical protein
MVKRRQVRGQTLGTAKPGMAYLFAQSCARYRRHGLGEQVFAKLKTLLRKTAERTVETT